MSNVTLLPIEQDFLNNPAVKTALNLNDIRRGQRNVDNAQKRKFEHTMTLAGHVASAYEWYKSPEGVLAMDEQGLSWTIVDFSKKVFGWEKSYFHKVRRAGNLDPRITTAFLTKCDELGDSAVRTLAGLLSFANDIDLSELPENATEEEVSEALEQAVEETEVQQREERIPTMATISIKAEANEGVAIAWRVDSEGHQSTSNTKDEILRAIAGLTNLINTL